MSLNYTQSISKRGISSLADKFKTREWKDQRVQREFLDALGNAIGIKKFDDWYDVKKTVFMEHGGSRLIALYSSHIQAITTIYTEYDWLTWKFSGVTRSFWDKIENQQKFMFHIEKELAINSKEDWYNVIGQDIANCGGGYLLKKYYQSSVFKLLVATIPEYKWLPWRFKRANSKGKFSITLFNFVDYWKDYENQKLFLEYLSKELGYKTMTDWYKINDNDISVYSGNEILEIYGSASNAVTKIFHSYPWEPWKFEHLERGYWTNKNNQRTYLNYLSKKLGITDWKDWYKVTSKVFIENDGVPLLYINGFSVAKVLMTCLQEYPWDPLLFPSRDKWASNENIRTRMDQIAKLLKVQKFEDWYQYRTEDLTENGGDIILQKRGGSIHKLLSETYPEYNFDPSKFSHSPRNLYNTVESQRRFFDSLMEKWNMSRLEEWYSVSKLDFLKAGASVIVRKYGSIPQTLRAIYPEFPWDWERSQRAGGGTKSQQRIFKQLLALLPNETLHQNFVQESKYLNSSRSFQLDVYVPSLKLAFEYQGEQHYKESVFGGDEELEERKRKDEEKRKLCREAGIKLIEIPYWWDGSIQELADLIQKEVPSLELNRK